VSFNIDLYQIKLPTMKLLRPVIFESDRCNCLRFIEGDVEMVELPLRKTAQT
jgi:hypothetical protein